MVAAVEPKESVVACMNTLAVATACRGYIQKNSSEGK
ncbi:hypothetical protein NK6_1597 [Bradyrhizobium diazoefficiens]|uniref:Uncharacterized protein n=1 Tax=Bradyrhizobium diazoefficiens TaxID=1355477 RepID=A0A0E4FRT0_9BRAD|nr:hypothetical protein NK6_1597 [Bradyrhizobium diazoefficiens]